MTAQEYYEQGNACRRQADWQGAITRIRITHKI